MMKSKIQIRLAKDSELLPGSGKPVIGIEYIPSDDLRDDVVGRFLKEFDGGYNAVISWNDEMSAYIYPVSSIQSEMNRNGDIFYGFAQGIAHSIGKSIEFITAPYYSVYTDGKYSSQIDRNFFRKCEFDKKIRLISGLMKELFPEELKHLISETFSKEDQEILKQQAFIF